MGAAGSPARPGVCGDEAGSSRPCVSCSGTPGTRAEGRWLAALAPLAPFRHLRETPRHRRRWGRVQTTRTKQDMPDDRWQTPRHRSSPRPGPPREQGRFLSGEPTAAPAGTGPLAGSAGEQAPLGRTAPRGPLHDGADPFLTVATVLLARLSAALTRRREVTLELQPALSPQQPGDQARGCVWLSRLDLRPTHAECPCSGPAACVQMLADHSSFPQMTRKRRGSFGSPRNSFF